MGSRGNLSTLIWDTPVSGSSEVLIETSGGGYTVTVGANALSSLENTIWLVDSNVAGLHARTLPSSLIRIDAIESSKSFEAVARIVESLRDQGTNRRTKLVAVGGGIVQDLATFSASCYMRGIQWIYCPTTMLSMVDSCIGGKSSINVGRYKNIAGNFYPPEKVLIDTKFCTTLTGEQVVEGLLEAAKICYAESDVAFANYLDIVEGVLVSRSDEALKRLIYRSLCAKKRFIEEDEFDRGIRLLLNFGHTFGHAIEGATSFEISHGLSVGLGMLAAVHCSERLGYCQSDQESAQKLAAHVRRLLSSVSGLGDKLRQLELANAMECFMSDKKHSAESFTLILLNQHGRLQRVSVPRSPVIKTEILNSLAYLKDCPHEIQ